MGYKLKIGAMSTRVGEEMTPVDIIASKDKVIKDWLNENPDIISDNVIQKATEEAKRYRDEASAIVTPDGLAELVLQNSDNIEELNTKTPTNASLNDETLEIKNNLGVVLFSVDLSDLVHNYTYGEIILSEQTIDIDEGTSKRITVKLANQPSINQTVYISVSDSTKLIPSVSSLLFTPSNYNVAQTIEFTAAEDDDVVGESITVTFTSKKVTSQQIAVAITDNDYMWIEDGCLVNIDWLSHVGSDIDTMTQIVDTVNGYSFRNFGTSNDIIATSSNQNGISTINNSHFIYCNNTELVTSIVNALDKNGTGMTFEQFGNVVSGIGLGLDFATYGVSVGLSNGSSGSSKTTAANIWTNGNNMRYIDSNGTPHKLDFPTSSNMFSDYYADHWHSVSTLSPDGVFKFYINGVKIYEETHEDFDHWGTQNVEFWSGAFKSVAGLTLLRYLTDIYGDSSGFISSQRAYTRVLTDSEILNNYHYETSRLALSAFR